MEPNQNEKDGSGDLRKLLNRALRSVPYLRISALEDVKTTFQKAYQKLQENLMSEEEKIKADSSNVNSQFTKNEKLRSLAVIDSSSENTNHDNDNDNDSKHSHGSFTPTRLINPVPREQSGVSRDFDSPDLSRRTLAGAKLTTKTGDKGREIHITPAPSNLPLLRPLSSDPILQRAEEKIDQPEIKDRTTELKPKLGLQGVGPKGIGGRSGGGGEGRSDINPQQLLKMKFLQNKAKEKINNSSLNAETPSDSLPPSASSSSSSSSPSTTSLPSTQVSSASSSSSSDTISDTSSKSPNRSHPPKPFTSDYSSPRLGGRKLISPSNAHGLSSRATSSNTSESSIRKSPSSETTELVSSSQSLQSSQSSQSSKSLVSQSSLALLAAEDQQSHKRKGEQDDTELSASPSQLKSSRFLLKLAKPEVTRTEESPKPEYLRKLVLPARVVTSDDDDDDDEEEEQKYNNLHKEPITDMKRQELKGLIERCLSLIAKMQGKNFVGIKGVVEAAVLHLEDNCEI